MFFCDSFYFFIIILQFFFSEKYFSTSIQDFCHYAGLRLFPVNVIYSMCSNLMRGASVRMIKCLVMIYVYCCCNFLSGDYLFLLFCSLSMGYFLLRGVLA
jgi:hypothetical protein